MQTDIEKAALAPRTLTSRAAGPGPRHRCIGGAVKSSRTTMESKTNGPPTEGIQPIMTQADFVDVLRDRRHAIGLTLADLDHVAGFHEGYASHLETPFTRSGKRSFKLTEMGAIWLQALGLQLLIGPIREGCSSSALGQEEDGEMTGGPDLGATALPASEPARNSP